MVNSFRGAYSSLWRGRHLYARYLDQGSKYEIGPLQLLHPLFLVSTAVAVRWDYTYIKCWFWFKHSHIQLKWSGNDCSNNPAVYLCSGYTINVSTIILVQKLAKYLGNFLVIGWRTDQRIRSGHKWYYQALSLGCCRQVFQLLVCKMKGFRRFVYVYLSFM